VKCSSLPRSATAALPLGTTRLRFSLQSVWVRLLTAAITLVVPGPLVTLDGQVASPEAQQLYDRHCTKCHRTDGTPKKIAKGAPAFSDPEWTATREQIEKSITNGKGDDMPRFKSKLTPEQIRALADRVLAFRAAGAQR
jgi:mono/diheme cytochrome c family protein